MRHFHNVRLIAVAGFLLTAVVDAPSAFARPGTAEIVMEAGTGRVLHARGADQSRKPASIAKVMTLFLVFDALDSGKLRQDQTLKVSRAAASQPATRLGLRAGAALSVRNAMRAVAVKSSNDAAVVLAEKLAGDERRFAALMTAKARAIGMRNTVFGNATGLPDRRTRTTARDIATLSRAILRAHPNRYALFGRRAIRWNERSMANHNHLLGRVTGVDGIKTGYTDRAGYTLAASAKRGNRRLIAVVLGAPTGRARDDRVGALLERGFAGRLERSVAVEPERRMRASAARGTVQTRDAARRVASLDGIERSMRRRVEAGLP
jgi:D-alanyl-D-alanine carboxypeptidase